MKKKILMPYLLTGGGHLGPAKALKSAIETLYPDKYEGILFEGFEENDKLFKALVEEGYTKISGSALLLYAIIYYAGSWKPIMTLGQEIVALRTKERFKKALKEIQPDLIVIFHPLLNFAVDRAVKELGMDIPVYVMVLDPFTPHPAWFNPKHFKIIVYTDYLYNIAKNKYKVPEENLIKLPMILNPKYSKKIPKEDIPSLKEKYGFNPNNKFVLIASGGVGLRNADEVLKYFLKDPELDNVDIAVVCGRDEDLKRRVEKVYEKEKGKIKRVVKIYGFIDFMYELQNMADVIITKAGASGTMEALVLEKPIIIASYIWGQEKGTVDFVVREKLGFHIENPKKVVAKLKELLNNPKLYEEIANNIRKHGFKNGYEEQARFFDQILSQR